MRRNPLAAVALAVLLGTTALFAQNPPVADFDWTPESPGLNEMVTVTDRSSGNPTSWIFWIENTHPQSGQTVYMGFNVAGTYEIKLEASNAHGSSTRRKWIPAGVPRAASFTSSPAAPSPGQAVDFSDRSSGLVTGWTWTFGDGGSSSVQNPSHVYQNAGSYSVKLVVSYANGTAETTRQVAVTNTAPLAADFSWSPEVPLINQPAQFTDRSTGQPTSWFWSFGDGETSTQPSPAHTYRSAGLFTVALTVKKGSSIETKTRDLYVRTTGAGGQPLVANYFWSPSSIVAGYDTQFTDLSRSGIPLTSWSWDFGDGTRSSLQNPLHRFGAPGSYPVSLTISDGVATDTLSRTLRVFDVPKPTPTADFMVSPSSLLTGDEASFFDMSTGNPTGWTWDFGDGTKSTEQNPRHTYTTRGSYLVTLTASNDGGSNTRGRSLLVLDGAAPLPDFTWSPPSPATGQEVQFRDTSTGDPTYWTWQFPDGSRRTTKNASFTFTRIGPQEITLTVGNTAGNQTTTKAINVLSPDALVADFECGLNWGVDSKTWRMCAYYMCADRSTGKPDKWIWSTAYWAPFLNDAYVFIPYKGPFPVTLTVRRADGATSSATKTLNDDVPCGWVEDGTPPAAIKPQADFTWEPNPARVGEKVTLTSQSLGGEATTFEWIVNGQPVSREKNLVHTFQYGGDVYVSLTLGNSAGADTRTKIVTVAGVSGPVFKNLKSKYGQCFFSTVDIDNVIETEVNWNGEADTLGWGLNGGAFTNIPLLDDGEGTQGFTLNTSKLQGAGEATPNVLTLFAKNDAEKTAFRNVILYRLDTSGRILDVTKTVKEPNRYSVTNATVWPNPEWEALVSLPSWVPWLGGKSFGLKKTQATIEETYRTDCTAAGVVKGQSGFDLGSAVVTVEIHGNMELGLTPTQGFVPGKGNIGIEVAGTWEVEPTPLPKFHPMGARFCGIPIVSELCELVKVKGEFKIAGGGDFNFTIDGKGNKQFPSATAQFRGENKLGLIAEAHRNWLFIEGWGGGQYGFTVGLPADPYFLKKFDFATELAFKVKIYLWETEDKWAISCTKEREKTLVCTDTATPLRPGSTGAVELTPIRVQEGTGERLSGKYRVLGESVVFTDVFALAAPAAVASGPDIVVAYLSENRNVTNILHRTDVSAAVLRAGTWRQIQPITADTLGDFAPALAARPDGTVFALWQRLRNPSLTVDDIKTTDDLPKVNREIEIVTSSLQPGGDSWSQPVALTDNTAFDHDPIALALADGRVLALWLRDPGNGLTGTAAAPTQLLARTWSGSAWGAEEVVAGDLIGVQALSGAARGNDATVVLSRDTDGNSATQSDREIAVVSYSAGRWSAVRDLTSDQVADLAPRVAYGNDGSIRVAWLSDGDLVWRALDGSKSTIRKSDASIALLNARLSVLPSGEWVVVWSEAVQGSSDLIARVYDGKTGLWSYDLPLTRNDQIESAVTAFAMDDRKLHAVALETEVKYEEVKRTIDGQEVTIRNVAGPGRVDLVHIDKEIYVDLGAISGSASSVPASPSPGQTVTVSASAVNAGNLPVRNVPILIRSGRDAGGEVLARDVVPGDWLAGETRLVSIQFPYGAQPDVTLVLDPEGVTGDREGTNNSVVASFSNRSPVACIQASGVTGTAPFFVSFDSSCSTDPDGTIVKTRWILGDGGEATGTRATYVFEKKGTFAVTATVTDDLGATTSTTVEVHVGTSPDLRHPPDDVESIYLPAVARAPGLAGTYFVSDAVVFNADARDDLQVHAVYAPDGRDDFYSYDTIVAANNLLALDDIVARAFHAPDGSGWVRFDFSHPHAVVSSRTYNKQPTGTAGTFVAGLRSADALVGGRTIVFPQDWREGYRVNIGFTEISGTGATITVRMFTLAGAEAGRKDYTLGAYKRIQVNSDPLFQQSGRIEVTVSEGTVLPYITTIDNQTGDSVFQSGVSITEGRAGESWLVPAVNRAPGLNDTNWRTDLRIYNASASGVNVTATLTYSGKRLSKSVPMAAGQTLAYDDAISSLFPEVSEDVSGVLWVTSPGPLAVTSRTYNASANGTYGLAVPARIGVQLLGPGDRGNLIQLTSDAGYRCNLALASHGSVESKVLVRGFDEKGRLVGEQTWTVPGEGRVQVNRIFDVLGAGQALPAGRLELDVVSGGRIYAYATVIDNKTGDGIFVEPAR
ncbi:MAG: PKD domain-containing protein [Thermoanaerobaculia bacterium]|nr:PKD domain-containing protein [Thermoanaerobaculia bacterium]